MEELLELALPLLVLVISFIAKSSKSKKAVIQHMEAAKMRTTESYLRREEMKDEHSLRPAAPAAVEKMAEKQPEIKVQPVFAERLTDDHQHEGRLDAPCPADEPRPSQRLKEKPAAPAVPGIRLAFDRNSVLQGFVMSEILNRPRPGMRR